MIKLVICSLELKWHKIFRNRNATQSLLDVDNFRTEEIKQKYKSALTEKLETDQTFTDLSPQEKWNDLVQKCKDVGKTVIPSREKNRKSSNPELVALSQAQKKIRLDIEASRSKDKRKNLQKKRRQLRKKIKNIIKEETNAKILDQIAEIENSKNDSTRMFKAIRILQKSTGKDNIVIHNQGGDTITNDKEKITEITKFFRESFFSNTAPSFPDIEPHELTQPFTDLEIEKAATKLKKITKALAATNYKLS